MMDDKKMVCFNCPIKLLAQFDKAIEGRYGDRTNALETIMRELVEKLKEGA